MTFNIISYTLFLFEMVLFFPSLMYAPWTTDDPPKNATGIRNSCPHWIQFNGFTLDDYPENIIRAKRRNVMLDQEATTFAAMYAFYIGGQEAPHIEILPHSFCYVTFKYNANEYPFIQLKDDSKTCPDWILSYGFVDYESNYNIGSTSNQNHFSRIRNTLNRNIYTSQQNTSHNILHARNQNLEKMKATSLFAYSYYDYLTRSENQTPIRPKEFCANLGLESYANTLKSFINTYGPELTCKAWIELYGFIDNIVFNITKANSLILNTKSNDYKKMPHLTRLYARRLRDVGIKDYDLHDLAPLNYCKLYIKAKESETYSFNYIHKTSEWDGYT